MSIILDALKKAEKERADADTQRSSPFNPISEEKKPKGKRPKATLIIPLLIIAVGLGSTLVYIKYFKNKASDNAAVAPKAFNPLPQNAKPEINEEQAMNEAMALYRGGSYEASKLKWDFLAQNDPENPEIRNNLGLVLKKMGQTDDAITAYEEALKIDPHYAPALNNLAAVYLAKKNYEKAGSYVEQAIKANPEYADAFFHRALIAEKKQDDQKALESFRKFLDLSPEIEASLRGKIEMRITLLKSKTL